MIQVDDCGRVALPHRIRRRLGILPQDLLEISVASDALILRRVELRCALCLRSAPAIQIKSRLICIDCLNELQRVTRCYPRLRTITAKTTDCLSD